MLVDVEMGETEHQMDTGDDEKIKCADVSGNFLSLWRIYSQNLQDSTSTSSERLFSVYDSLYDQKRTSWTKDTAGTIDYLQNNE